ncbi:MAG: glycine zipper domain-containing protein [Mesorhizobium sp.]
MKKILVLAALLLPIAACSQTERGAAIGGLGGAAIGSAVANDPVEGAVIGGAIGAVGGALIGNASERGQCRYRNRYGRVYVARCPSDYRYDNRRNYDRRYYQRRHSYGGY